MIICTEHTLKIGERVLGPVSDAHLVRHVVGFVVLREVTHADYLRHAAEAAPHHEPVPFDAPTRFYEVAMD